MVIYKLWEFGVGIRHLGDSKVNWGGKDRVVLYNLHECQEIYFTYYYDKRRKVKVCGRETVWVVPGDKNRNVPKETLGPVES